MGYKTVLWGFLFCFENSSVWKQFHDIQQVSGGFNFSKAHFKAFFKIGGLNLFIYFRGFLGGHCLTYLSGGAFILEISNAFKP